MPKKITLLVHLLCGAPVVSTVHQVSVCVCVASTVEDVYMAKGYMAEHAIMAGEVLNISFFT